MKTAAGAARAVLGTALAAGMLLGGCEGNVNDDTVPVLPIDVVSRTASGALPSGRSYGPSISGDGRLVTFTARSPGMHPLDTNSFTDVFVRDTETGTTTLVSINAQRTGAGNGHSKNARISPDGGFVAFWSQASNICSIPGWQDNNYSPDIYVHCLKYGTTLPVSVSVEGGMLGLRWEQGGCIPDIATDGSYVYVVFENPSPVTDKYQIWLRRIPIDSFEPNQLQPDLGVTYLVSVPCAGQGSYANDDCKNPVITLTLDSILVAWDSKASILTTDQTGGKRNVFLRTMNKSTPDTGTTYMITACTLYPDGDSYVPVISRDGTYVAFTSAATNLHITGGDTDYNGVPDVYLKKSDNGWLRLISKGPSGLANSESFAAGISSDGRYVLFSSNASNLVEGDTNDATDVFLKDTREETVTRVSLTMFGGEPYGESGSCEEVVWDFEFKPAGGADLSGDGRTAVFQSRASNILPGIVLFDGMQIYRRKF